jgi:hypothetical protein
MARKRQKLTTPEREAELDARTERIHALLRAMDARAEAYKRDRAERQVRRQRWRRFLPFRRAA